MYISHTLSKDLIGKRVPIEPLQKYIYDYKI